MRTQQQAEREEQQRIKNLVLNYDLNEPSEDTNDGIYCNKFLQPNRNSIKTGSLERPSGKPDKSGVNRSAQRSRKLQLSDVDWYGNKVPSDSKSQEKIRPKMGQGNAVLRRPEQSAKRAEARRKKIEALKGQKEKGVILESSLLTSTGG